MSISNNQLLNLFIQGPNISIYPSGNSYAISGSSAGIISGTNAGTGVSIISSLTTTNNINDTLGFYTLSGGNQVSVGINEDGEIIIDRGQIILNTLSTQGSGARIYSGIVGNAIVHRTIQGTGSGFTTALSGAGNVNVFIRPTNTTLDRFYNITNGPVLNTSTLILPSATTGNMGIGVSSITTSRLLIATGSSSISQIDLTPFANEPTNPSDGSIWYSTSGNTLRFEKGTIATDFIFKDNNSSLSGNPSILAVDTGGTITPKYVNSFGVFDSTPTVVSFYNLEENIEKSIIPSTIVGSTTLSASTNLYNPELVVGRKYRYIVKGSIFADTTTFLSTPYLYFNIKLGSTTIITVNGGIYIDAPNIYSGEFEIDVTFTIRNSGLIVGSGKVLFLTSPPTNFGGDPVIYGLYSQNTTIDTTINQVFDCTCYLTGGMVDLYIDTFDITINESFLEILN